MVTIKGKNANVEKNVYPITITGVTFGPALPTRVGNLPRDSTPAVDTAYFTALNPYNAAAVAGGAVMPAGYAFNGNVAPTPAGAAANTMSVTIPTGALNYEQIAKIEIAFTKTKQFVDRLILPSKGTIDYAISKHMDNLIKALYKDENEVNAGELETLIDAQ